MNIMSRHSLGPKTKYVHDQFRFGLRNRASSFVCCSQDRKPLWHWRWCVWFKCHTPFLEQQRATASDSFSQAAGLRFDPALLLFESNAACLQKITGLNGAPNAVTAHKSPYHAVCFHWRQEIPPWPYRSLKRATTFSELCKRSTLQSRFILLYDTEFLLSWFSHMLAALVLVRCHSGAGESWNSPPKVRIPFVCHEVWSTPTAGEQPARDGGLHVPFAAENNGAAQCQTHYHILSRNITPKTISRRSPAHFHLSFILLRARSDNRANSHRVSAIEISVCHNRL